MVIFLIFIIRVPYSEETGGDMSYFESLGSWLSLLRQNSQLREIRKLATVATKGYDVDEGPQGEGQGAASYCGNAEESGV